MKLKCPRITCKNEWEYTGDKKPNKNFAVYVCCPICRTSVKLEEVKEDIQYEGINWCVPDIKDIKKKMRWSFENRNKIKEMGKNAQEFISKNFTWKLSAKKALEFLKEISQ